MDDEWLSRERSGMPTFGRTPVEWLTQQVVIRHHIQAAGPSPTPIPTSVALLEGISDWGVTVTNLHPSREEVRGITLFFPWDEISSIRLANENERIPLGEEQRPSSHGGEIG